MSYITVKMKSDSLIVIINDSRGLDTSIKTVVDSIVGNTNVSDIFKLEIYETILRQSILDSIDKSNIKLEHNKSYIVNFIYNDIKYRYNIVSYNHKTLGKGLNISKTILL